MRETRFQLRCADAELAAWRRAAKRDGRSLSDWIRRRLTEGGRGRSRSEPAGRIVYAPDRHDVDREWLTVALDHPAIRRASELAAERERFRPDPKPRSR
jgi:hypothetical protein